MQGREVLAEPREPASVGVGGGPGREEEGPDGHQQSMPCATKSGSLVIAKAVSDAFLVLLTVGPFNAVWPAPSQQQLAQRSWVSE